MRANLMTPEREAEIKRCFEGYFRYLETILGPGGWAEWVFREWRLVEVEDEDIPF